MATTRGGTKKKATKKKPTKLKKGQQGPKTKANSKPLTAAQKRGRRDVTKGTRLIRDAKEHAPSNVRQTSPKRSAYMTSYGASLGRKHSNEMIKEGKETIKKATTTKKYKKAATAGPKKVRTQNAAPYKTMAAKRRAAAPKSKPTRNNWGKKAMVKKTTKKKSSGRGQ